MCASSYWLLFVVKVAHYGLKMVPQHGSMDEESCGTIFTVCLKVILKKYLKRVVRQFVFSKVVKSGKVNASASKIQTA